MLKDLSRTEDESKAIMVVTGMRSDNCAKQVTTALNKVDGVANVVVDWPRNEVIVTYDSDKVKIKELGETVKEVGFNVGGVI